MFNISFSKPISSISGGTLRSTRQPKSFKVAPYIKTVSFHFQTSIYGIKCNIAKKNCAVDLKERHMLSELLRLVEAAWAAEVHPSLSIVLAQHLEKAHLPKIMKSLSFPVESYEFSLSNKNLSVFVLHRDFPCSMPALQNLTHQPAEAPFWEHLCRFTFRPRIKYNSDTWSSLFHFRCFSTHPFAHGMRLMAISKICVSAHMYNKSSKIQ